MKIKIIKNDKVLNFTTEIYTLNIIKYKKLTFKNTSFVTSKFVYNFFFIAHIETLMSTLVDIRYLYNNIYYFWNFHISPKYMFIYAIFSAWALNCKLNIGKIYLKKLR